MPGNQQHPEQSTWTFGQALMGRDGAREWKGYCTASRTSSNHTKPKPGGLRATQASFRVLSNFLKKSRRSRCSASAGRPPM